MSSYGEYKKVSDVVTDINIMVQEAPLPNKVKRQLADIAYNLNRLTDEVKDHLENSGDCIGLHHDE